METQSETPIAQLMARDPLGLSSQDLDAIIAELRRQRHIFVVKDDKKIGTPAARKTKAQLSKEETGKLLDQLSLDDLLGGL